MPNDNNLLSEFWGLRLHGKLQLAGQRIDLGIAKRLYWLYV